MAGKTEAILVVLAGWAFRTANAAVADVLASRTLLWAFAVASVTLGMASTALPHNAR